MLLNCNVEVVGEEVQVFAKLGRRQMSAALGSAAQLALRNGHQLLQSRDDGRALVLANRSDYMARFQDGCEALHLKDLTGPSV